MPKDSNGHGVGATAVGALALLLVLAVAPPAEAGDGSQGQLIGFAGPATDGSFNILTYNARCENSHPGRAAHMCTSRELLAYPPSLASEPPDVGFWVHPVVVGVATYLDVEGGDHVAYRDYSGIHGGAFVAGLEVLDRADRLSCNGWSSGDGEYMGLSFDGLFRLAPCDEVKFVACCGKVCDADCKPPQRDPPRGVCCRLPDSTGAALCRQTPTCDECVVLGGACSDGTCNPGTGKCEARR